MPSDGLVAGLVIGTGEMKDWPAPGSTAWYRVRSLMNATATFPPSATPTTGMPEASLRPLSTCTGTLQDRPTSTDAKMWPTPPTFLT